MKTKIHSIHYPFGIDTGAGTLAEESKYSRHVVQLIKQVLFTNPGERINRPDFGCGIRRMVFAPNSDVNANMSQVIITQSLEKWLGTIIEVNKVEVNYIEESLYIKIVYLLSATQESKYLNLEVTL